MPYRKNHTNYNARLHHIAATALEGVREGECVAAGAGRVALATQQGLSQQRAAMSKELQALEMATAQEESRLRDIGIQLDPTGGAGSTAGCG